MHNLLKVFWSQLLWPLILLFKLYEFFQLFHSVFHVFELRMLFSQFLILVSKLQLLFLQLVFHRVHVVYYCLTLISIYTVLPQVIVEEFLLLFIGFSQIFKLTILSLNLVLIVLQFVLKLYDLLDPIGILQHFVHLLGLFFHIFDFLGPCLQLVYLILHIWVCFNRSMRDIHLVSLFQKPKSCFHLICEFQQLVDQLFILNRHSSEFVIVHFLLWPFIVVLLFLGKSFGSIAY